MARYEHDREDLMREAVQLVPRAAWKIPHEPVEVVTGFRGKALSVFFGADPVYHFNEAGALRRAYVDGRLWKGVDERLVVMQRKRTAEEVVLASRTLDPEETESALRQVAERLLALRRAFETGQATCRQRIPPEAAMETRLVEALQLVAASPRLADRPGLAAH